MKRCLSIGLATTLAFTMLTGCGSNASTVTNESAASGTTETTDAKKSGDEVTITMVESLTSAERTAMLRDIADTYEAENPGVKIEIVSPPLENADAKITQMLMSGNGVDVLEVRDSTISQYASNNWLLDLKPYVDAWDQKDTLSEATYNAMNYVKTGEYLVPYGFYQRCLFYRTDILEENGIEVPATWEELYNDGVKLTDSGATQYGYSFRGGSSGYQYADTMMWGYLGTDKLASPYAGYYLKDGDGKTIFTTPEAKKALEDYKKFYKDCSPEDSISWAFSEMVQGFVGGTCAFLIQDADTIATVADSLEEGTWNTAPFPIGPSGEATFPNGYAGWGVASSSANQDQAADFVLYLSNVENNTLFAKNYGVIPIHTNAGEYDDAFENGYFSVYMTYANKPETYVFATEPQMYQGFAQFKETIDEMYQKYLLDEISVDDLLQYMDEYWSEVYENEGQLW